MVKETAAIVGRVFRFAALLPVAVAVYYLLHQTSLYGFTARERDGFGVVILLVGNIYAVMFAFVIFVIWSQFNRGRELCDARM